MFLYDATWRRGCRFIKARRSTKTEMLLRAMTREAVEENYQDHEDVVLDESRKLLHLYSIL